MFSDFFEALLIAQNSGLIGHEIMHGLITLPFAVFIYFKTKSIKLFLLTLITTYLIDLDHLVDYFLYYGLRFNFTEFLSFKYVTETSSAVIPFHGWEWVAMLGLLAWQERKFSSIKAAVALGALSHLIWDSYGIGSILFYSIFYRVINEFIVLI